MADSIVEILIKAKDQASRVVEKLNKDFKKAGDAAKKFGQDSKKAGKVDFSKLHKSLDQIKKKLDSSAVAMQKFGEKTRQAGEQMTQAGTSLLAAGAALGAPLVLALKSFGGFEKAMSKVQAISGATGEEFAKMTDLAKEMGRTTQFTAQESAEAMTFLSQAGLSTTEVLEALPGSLELAAAGGLDLATAADLATNVVAGLGLEMDQLSRVNDAMALAASRSNTSVYELGEALKTAGPAAKGSGVELEEVVSVLGGLANAGIKGGEAGNAVKRMLVSLQKPSAEARETLKRLNITTTDAEGNFRGLLPVLGDLGEAQLDLADASRLFGLYAGPAAVAASGQVKSMRDLDEALKKAQGSARKMAQVMLDNLAGSFTKLLSALDGLLIAIGEDLAGVLRGMVDSITESVTSFTDWYNSMGEVGKTAILTVAAIASLAVALGLILAPLGLIIVGFGSWVTVGGKALAFMLTFGGKIGIVSAAMKLAAVAGRGFMFVLTLISRHPIIAALTALGYTVYKLVDAYDEYSEATDQLNDFQQTQLDIIEKQKRAGADDTRIKSAEELLSLSKEQLDAYQDELLAKMRLVGAERALALSRGDQEVADTAEAEMNALTLAIENSVEAEKKLEAAAKAAAKAGDEQAQSAQQQSVVLTATKEDIKRLGDEMLKLNQIRYDQQIAELNRVHEANIAALTIKGDVVGLQNEYTLHFNTLKVLAQENSRQRIELTRRTINQQKQLALAGTVDEKEIARIKLDAERQLTDQVIQIKRQEISTISNLRQQSFNKYKALTQQVADLEKRIADTQLAGQFRVNDLQRQGLGDYAAYQSKKREISQLTSQFNQALAAKDYKLAESLAQRQIALSGQLVGEIKEGETVQLSKEQSVKAAVENTKASQDRLLQSMKAQKAEAKAAADAQKALFTSLDATLKRLDTTLRGLQGKSVDIETKLAVPTDAEAETEVKKPLAAMQRTAEEEAIDAEIRAKFTPEQFFNAVNEIRARMEGEGVDVDMIPKVDLINETKRILAAETTNTNVKFNPNTRAVDAAIARLRRNTYSTHTIRVVEQRSVGGLIGSNLPRFATGGSPNRAIGAVSGPGTSTSDSIMARLSNGEFVIKAAAVKKYGQNLFNSLNQMHFPTHRLPRFATGGAAFTPASGRVAGEAAGQKVTLDLNMNGNQLGSLTGSRDTVNGLVTALKDIQRNLPGG